MEFINNDFKFLPNDNLWHTLCKYIPKEGIPMKDMLKFYGEVPKLGCGLFDILSKLNPEVMPAEPITKPAPIKEPRPAEDDPFNVPAPKVDPTPKGFLYF